MSNPAPDTTASRLPRGWQWATWALLCTAIGLLNANHFYLNDAANGHSGVLLPYLLEELTGCWSAGALALLVLVPAIRRIRHQSRRWLRCVSHLGLLLGFSWLHTSLIWISRLLLFPLFGLGHYDYGVMSWRYPMEFPSDVIVYALTACVTWLADHYRAGRERELRAAALESALAEARLEALRLQLNPHFLFNALNAVSSTMYEQPRAADEMLARIGDLLRATLQAQSQQHRLADELKLLRLYLDIQRARFGDDCLRVVLDFPPGLDALRVPFLVLQPLAENAFEHGGAPHHDVSIHASSDKRCLHLRVRNRGGADADPRRGHGIGLVNIQSRLRYLYGEQAGLALQAIEGGTEAHLWLPLDAVSA